METKYSERNYFIVGDKVIVPMPNKRNNKAIEYGTIFSIDAAEGKCMVEIESELKEFDLSDLKKNLMDDGHNPFAKRFNVDNKAFSIETLLGVLGLDKSTPDENGNIHEMFTIKNGIKVYQTTINPHVTINGEQVYYQRGLVWDLARKQKLIESIYNYLECGNILLRSKQEDDESLITEDYAWFEVVDGKQRLMAIYDFVNDRFPDSNGFYFSDLSPRAKISIRNSLSFKVGIIRCSDKEVINQFVVMNHGGVPQEAEHLNMLKEKIKN